MKKLMNYFVIAMTCIAFLGTSTAIAQDWSKDQKEVWETIEDGWAAWKSGDADAAFKGVHERYLGWNNDEPLPTTKEKWMESYKMYKEYMTIEYYSLNPARILIEGDNAIVYYYFEFYSVYAKGDKKQEKQVVGKNVEFYVKDGGKWMLLGDMTYFDDGDD